jgi:hypothetical protein
MASLVKRVQRGIMGSSNRAEVREGPSQWIWNAVSSTWQLLLHQTQRFKDLCLRPFLRAALRIFRCHNDIQWWDGQGALLRYTVGYVSKYREAWDALALKEDHTAWHSALSLLRTWHAAEPEMAMVLGRQPLLFKNFITKEYNPRFFESEEDAELFCYRRRSTALENMRLHDWLRQHTVSGHPHDGTAKAIAHTKKGIYVLGVRYKLWFNDMFFWQWLVMNKPHRDVRELLPRSRLQVSENYRFFTMALFGMPGTWDTDSWIKQYFEKQGDKADYIEDTVSRMRAIRGSLTNLCSDFFIQRFM